MRRSSIILALSILSLTATARAAEKFAGQWEMTFMSLKVTVESWGENCGPEPVSYTSKRARPVTIEARGRHVVFSKGGMRTDRCSSPNPRLTTISKKTTPGNWKRICQTKKNDPKFERGEYSLVAKGDLRLEYTGISKFDWTLKGDHCIARSDERRTYIRVSPIDKKEEQTPEKKEEQIPEKEEEQTPEKKEAEIEKKIIDPLCEDPGPTLRIVIQPRKVRLGPGEGICFKAVAVDANGCKVVTKTTWTAMQGGQAVNGLLSTNGCFRAGDTAADSEGLYIVTARTQGKTDSSQVTVVFPDLGELLAARLNPLEDLDKTEEADAGSAPVSPDSSASIKAPPTPPSALPPVVHKDTVSKPTPKKAEKNPGSLAIILVISGIAFIGLLLIIIFSFKKRALRKKSEGDDFEAWIDASNGPSKHGRDKSVPVQKQKKEPHQAVICPMCGNKFPKEARFCPHDRAPLVPEDEIVDTNSSESNPGMVCPKCHRGYDSASHYCPHDSESLVPFPEWRARDSAKRK
ncbi:MAG: zinc ribbon domain-containing protein [Proteobacteria bacterium]|nr:zinc ribbon domain-containing protein [Pseudomonadota bacterium]